MFGCFYFCEPTAVYDFYGGLHLLADNSLQKTAKTASRAVWVSEGCHPEKSIRSTFRSMLPLFSRVGGKAGGAVISIRRDGHIRNPGPVRALATGLHHSGDSLRRARHQRLDTAVRPVSDPAAQPQARGGARRPKPVADALHLAGNAEADGFLQRPSIEFEDYLVDSEAVAGICVDARDAAVTLGTQHVLHLHRFDNRERLAGLHLLALLDDNR